MAVTWKEVALADNVPNLGNADLASTASTRNFTLQGEVGNAAKRLKIKAEADSGESLTFMDLYTGNYPLAEGAWTGSEVNFEAASIDFNATSIVSITSDFVMSLAAPVFTANIDSFVIQSINTTASSMPVLSLKRLPNPDDVGQTNDNIGQIKFEGENAANGSEVYASIDVKIHDATAASEDGEMDIQLMTGGYSQSHLKILPNSAQTETLKRIEVSGTDLWSLIQTATKYNCRKTYKMYAGPTSNWGLPEGQGCLFRFSEMEHYSARNNTAYDISAATLNAWEAGTTNIDGGEGTLGLMSQDADDEAGISDSWFTHSRDQNTPGATIRIRGQVWWQARFNQVSGQTVKFHLGYHQRTLLQESGAQGITDEDAFGFTHQAVSGEHYLATGYLINKMPIDFTVTVAAAAHAEPKLEMFCLAVEAYNTSSASYIGAGESDVSSNHGSFVADLEMEVLSISA